VAGWQAAGFAALWALQPAGEQGQQGPASAAVQQVSVGFWLGNR